MNKIVIYALVAFFLFLGGAYMCSRKSVEHTTDTTYGQQLVADIQKAEAKKLELEAELAELDSTLAGGQIIYILHVRASKANVNVKTRIGEGDAVDFTIPTSREFWHIVKPGDVLNAGVDYKGFTFTQNIKGFSVLIVNKDKYKYEYGLYPKID